MTKINATLSSSQEDYLETIFEIAGQKGAARPKDIAVRLNVTPASVTGALKHLAEKGLINYAPYDVVTLTSAGKKIAKEIHRKHLALFGFFANVLDIDTQEAEEFACRMEHGIPDHVLERFIAFSEFVQRCPNSGAVWRGKAKGYFCSAQTGGKTLCQDCKLDAP